MTADNTSSANQPDEQTAVTDQPETTEQIDPPDPSEQGGNNSGQSSVDTENSVDNENTDPTGESEVILVGVFLDSAVANLAYKTASQSGFTDELGRFYYQANETIVFGVGELAFPEVSARDVITPVDLFPGAAVNHRGVVNVSRVLQTLDTDNDPSNGISLDQWTHSIELAQEIDFESLDFSETVNDIISTYSSSSRSLISGSEAIAHLAETLVSSDIPVTIEDENQGLILLDTNTNGIPDNFDWDDDGDGVYDAQDRFPLDPSEQFDTDNDGLGNNADPDDDNDGYPDTADAFPLSGSEHLDSDNDGIGNHADTDDDNDGTEDFVDAFPLNAAEQIDSDSDGVGNNSDDDDDNDGYPDSEDAFPFTSLESHDTDGDGIGNNVDSDDDNDGVEDIVDAFPLDKLEFADTDADGIGNNADDDDDGDGIPDAVDNNQDYGDNTPPNLSVPLNMVISNRVGGNAAVGVSDAENNTIRVSWTVESGPVDGDMTLVISENFTEAVIRASVSGLYVIGVRATDGIDTTYRTFIVEVANSAPVVSGISIDPQQPTTGMYLNAFHPQPEDADGDFLTLTYTWLINGNVVDNDSAYLPPGLAQRGDKVALRLKVFDGTHEVQVESEEIEIVNSPPSVQSVEILPFQATVTDELVLSLYSLSDDDGDSIDLSYQWKLNDQILTDQTASSLPSGIAKHQDIVAVQVILSDSVDTVEVDPVSLVISDAPSVFDHESVPLSLNYGEQAEFFAGFVDPDGTDVETVLVSAPEGLIYDGVTGLVRWTPTPLMFQSKESFEAHFISSDSQIATIKLNVVDVNREMVIARSGIDVPVISQPLDSGDFDGDGRIEVLSSTRGQRIFTLELDGSEIVQDWMYPYTLGVDGEIRSVWAHGEDKSQIIAVTENNIVVIESRETSPVSARSFDQDLFTSRYADLDVDGVAELIVIDEYGVLSVLETDTWELKWPSISLISSSEFGTRSYAMDIANLDTDPGLEIVTNTGDLIDGSTGTVQWKHGTDFGLLITTGDIDGDGHRDIVSSARWDNVTSYDVATQSSIWAYDLSDTCALKMINIDNDVQDELIHGGCQHGRIEIYDGATGTAVMQEFIDDPDFNSGFTSLTVTDIDTDGFSELVFGTGTGTTAEDNMVVASIPGTDDTTPGVAINTDPSQLGAFYMAGWDTITGNENRAVFVMPDTQGNQDGQRVGILSETGDLAISDLIDWNWDDLHAARVVDSNNDGISEIFLATARTYDGRLVQLTLDNFTELAVHTDSEEARSIAIGVAEDGSSKAVVGSSDAKLRTYDIAGAVTDWTSGALTGSLRSVMTRSIDDGFEIIAATSSELTLWTPNTDGFTKSYTAAAECYYLDIISVDGEDYIVCAESDSFWYSTTTLSVFNTQLIKQVETSLDFKITATRSTGGSQLLIGATKELEGQSSSSSLKEYTLRLFDPLFGTTVWTSRPLVGQINGIDTITDPVTGEGKIAVATSAAIYVTH